jgi:hypothetical protein
MCCLCFLVCCWQRLLRPSGEAGEGGCGVDIVIEMSIPVATKWMGGAIGQTGTLQTESSVSNIYAVLV